METRALQVFECSACGHRVYPARLRCPACGAAGWRHVAVAEGQILAWTQLAQPDGDLATIATVRILPAGPDLVARLVQPPRQAGQRIALAARTTGGRLLPWGAWDDCAAEPEA